MTHQEYLTKIAQAMEDGFPRNVEKLVCEAVETGISPRTILQDSLIPAMQKIGSLYKDEEIYIIKILSSARAMQRGMKVLRPYLEKDTGFSCGKAIIGTAEGDLHDMGKNLVALMFETAGFEVVDLGVDVTVKKFVKAVEENPDAVLVCVSSLLTTSMENMKQIVEVLNKYKKQYNFKIMVGGGPITEEFANQIGADAYTADAYEAAAAAKEISEER